MQQITGTFSTTKGRKYITQLCKHFAHKIETGVEDSTGWAKFPMGLAEMSASDTLLTIRMGLRGPEDIESAKHVIDSHLVTFAFRENFDGMVWGKATDQ